MTDAFEYPAIDLEPHRQGNTGIAYAHRFMAAAPGPTVLVTALTHGNELCGAYAVDRMLRQGFRPRRGTLALCFVNVEAYRRFNPARPLNGRFVEEDFNRLWSPAILEGPRQSVELKRARAIRPLVDEADYLLDLHSMQTDCPALTLCGLNVRALELGLQVGGTEHFVVDAGHRGGQRMRDYGGFGDPASRRTSLLVECGQHGRRASVEVAIDTTNRFLAVLGMSDQAPPPPVAPPSIVEVVQAVTVESNSVRFEMPYAGL